MQNHVLISYLRTRCSQDFLDFKNIDLFTWRNSLNNLNKTCYQIIINSYWYSCLNIPGVYNVTDEVNLRIKNTVKACLYRDLKVFLNSDTSIYEFLSKIEELLLSNSDPHYVSKSTVAYVIETIAMPLYKDYIELSRERGYFGD